MELVYNCRYVIAFDQCYEQVQVVSGIPDTRVVCTISHLFYIYDNSTINCYYIQIILLVLHYFVAQLYILSNLKNINLIVNYLHIYTQLQWLIEQLLISKSCNTKMCFSVCTAKYKIENRGSINSQFSKTDPYCRYGIQMNKYHFSIVH